MGRKETVSLDVGGFVQNEVDFAL